MKRSPAGNKPPFRTWAKRLVQVLGLIVVMDVILFVLAGRFDWLGAWILTLLYLTFLVVTVGWMMQNAPELLEERNRIASNVKSWDKILLTLYAINLLGLLVVAAVDVRFHWTQMPVALQVLGILGMISCGVWLFWVTKTNPYLSRFARIQDDRGQQVVTTGPYRYIRHPMYASMIFFGPCVALTLGSWVGSYSA